jgi:hypothetical protein
MLRHASTAPVRVEPQGRDCDTDRERQQQDSKEPSSASSTEQQSSHQESHRREHAVSTVAAEGIREGSSYMRPQEPFQRTKRISFRRKADDSRKVRNTSHFELTASDQQSVEYKGAPGERPASNERRAAGPQVLPPHRQ